MTYDDASEQTVRAVITDVKLPDDVDRVVFEAHDSVKGWGGGTESIPVSDGAPHP